MHRGRTTLTKFLIEEQRKVPGATGDLTGLLDDVATACKVIAHAVGKGRLAASGDGPAALDDLAGEVMVRAHDGSGHLAAMTSSRGAQIVTPAPGQPRGKYLLAFDPLDGASGLDLNSSLATIFSVARCPDLSREARDADFLQAASSLVAAGFALYGPATIFVLTTGNGVHGFTLDPDIGEFVLTHPALTIAPHTSQFAIDPSDERYWEPPVKRYVDEALSAREFRMRWIACLAAETWRVLARGGVVLYPVETRCPEPDRRLRLLHEAAPIAFLVEQAGGAATTGRGRLADVAPRALHERTPLIFGSRDEVLRIETHYEDYIAGRESDTFDQPLFRTRSLFRT